MHNPVVTFIFSSTGFVIIIIAIAILLVVAMISATPKFHRKQKHRSTSRIMATSCSTCARRDSNPSDYLHEPWPCEECMKSKDVIRPRWIRGTK